MDAFRVSMGGWIGDFIYQIIVWKIQLFNLRLTAKMAQIFPKYLENKGTIF